MKRFSMALTLMLCLLFNFSSLALCADGAGDLDYENIEFTNADDDLAPPAIDDWSSNLALTGDEAKNLVEGLDGLNPEQVKALIDALEAALNGGSALSGTVLVDGKEVGISEELRRQMDVWGKSIDFAYMSIEADGKLSELGTKEFTEKTPIDSPAFEKYFTAVIDSERFAVEDHKAELVDPNKYIVVASYLKAIDDDMFQYNNAVFLARQQKDLGVATGARNNLGTIKERMQLYVAGLKRVFPES